MIDQTVVDRIELTVLVENDDNMIFLENWWLDGISLFKSFTMPKVLSTEILNSKNFEIERFKIARGIQKNSLVDYIIFLDEDFQLENSNSTISIHYQKDYIEQLWDSRKPRSHLGWNGKLFSESDDHFYEDSNRMQEMIIEKEQVVGMNGTYEWHYTKIGGSVVDAGIFQDADLLSCPKGFEEFDGMWLDYLMHSHGWFMGKIEVKPIIEVSRSVTVGSTILVRLRSLVIFEVFK